MNTATQTDDKTHTERTAAAGRIGRARWPPARHAIGLTMQPRYTLRS